MKAIEYFQAGEHIALAGLTVIRVMVAGRNQKCTLYEVEFDCCGEIDEISGYKINRRRSRTRKLRRDAEIFNPGCAPPGSPPCVHCANSIELAEKMDAFGEIAIQPPSWAPPASSLVLSPSWVLR